MIVYIWVTVKGTYLKPSHIARVSGILQTILVAFQEEFEKKPAKKKQD